MTSVSLTIMPTSSCCIEPAALTRWIKLTIRHVNSHCWRRECPWEPILACPGLAFRAGSQRRFPVTSSDD